MKTFFILAVLMFLLPAKADMLSDIINGKYNYPSDTYDKEEEDEEEYARSDYEAANGEHYSWDNIYLCSYCYDTEVIINPYSSNNDVLFSY